jgi:ribosomal protein L37E
MTVECPDFDWICDSCGQGFYSDQPIYCPACGGETNLCD